MVFIYDFIITNEETVYALAGSNVTLKCSILQGKETHITQIQWSKSADRQSRIIAVHNPLYASFEKECNHWILQLKNVTLELSGSYEFESTGSRLTQPYILLRSVK
uniref:Immunoglobulin domain-containing protein n=1 Tax=Naja naja TaxID=35670 RepID=A0A8C6X7L9_NAJNA